MTSLVFLAAVVCVATFVTAGVLALGEPLAQGGPVAKTMGPTEDGDTGSP